MNCSTLITTLVVSNVVSRLKRSFLLVPALALVLFAFSTAARAVTPPPDGGYPNNNTAEGDDALLHLTTGGQNTAIGFEALFKNTMGDSNTASGFQALFNNATVNGVSGDS